MGQYWASPASDPPLPASNHAYPIVNEHGQTPVRNVDGAPHASPGSTPWSTGPSHDVITELGPVLGVVVHSSGQVGPETLGSSASTSVALASPEDRLSPSIVAVSSEMETGSAIPQSDSPLPAPLTNASPFFQSFIATSSQSISESAMAPDFLPKVTSPAPSSTAVPTTAVTPRARKSKKVIPITVTTHLSTTDIIERLVRATSLMFVRGNVQLKVAIPKTNDLPDPEAARNVLNLLLDRLAEVCTVKALIEDDFVSAHITKKKDKDLVKEGFWPIANGRPLALTPAHLQLYFTRIYLLNQAERSLRYSSLDKWLQAPPEQQVRRVLTESSAPAPSPPPLVAPPPPESYCSSSPALPPSSPQPSAVSFGGPLPPPPPRDDGPAPYTPKQAKKVMKQLLKPHQKEFSLLNSAKSRELGRTTTKDEKMQIKMSLLIKYEQKNLDFINLKHHSPEPLRSHLWSLLQASKRPVAESSSSSASAVVNPAPPSPEVGRENPAVRAAPCDIATPIVLLPPSSAFILAPTATQLPAISANFSVPAESNIEVSNSSLLFSYVFCDNPAVSMTIPVEITPKMLHVLLAKATGLLLIGLRVKLVPTFRDNFPRDVVSYFIDSLVDRLAEASVVEHREPHTESITLKPKTAEMLRRECFYDFAYGAPLVPSSAQLADFFRLSEGLSHESRLLRHATFSTWQAATDQELTPPPVSELSSSSTPAPEPLAASSQASFLPPTTTATPPQASNSVSTRPVSAAKVRAQLLKKYKMKLKQLVESKQEELGRPLSKKEKKKCKLTVLVEHESEADELALRLASPGQSPLFSAVTSSVVNTNELGDSGTQDINESMEKAPDASSSSSSYENPSVPAPTVDFSHVTISTDVLKGVNKMLTSLPTTTAELRDLMSTAKLFLIDGDALLLMFASPANPYGTAHNSLSIYYHIERYLSDLQKNGGEFEVIFFGISEMHYLESDPATYLLSTNLYHHLRDCTNLIVHWFGSCRAPEWRSFCEDVRPGMLLTWLPSVGSSDKKAETGSSVVGDLQFSLQCALICNCILQNMRIADVKDVQFGDLIRFKVSEPWDSMQASKLLKPLTQICNQIKCYPLFTVVTHFYRDDQVLPSKSAVESSVALLSPALIPASPTLPLPYLNIRGSYVFALVTISLHVGLHSGLLNESESKLILLLYVLQPRLGIYDRTQNLPSLSPGSDSAEYLASPPGWHAWVKTLSFTRSEFHVEADNGSMPLKNDLSDLLDRRLYASMLDHLRTLAITDDETSPSPQRLLHDSSALGFSEDMLAEIQAVWSCVSSNEADSATPPPFWPISIPDAPALVRPLLEPASSKLWPVRYNLADRVRQADGSALPELKIAEVKAHEKHLSHNQVFSDNRHWRSGKIILAQEHIYMDERNRGKYALEAYIKRIAENLNSPVPASSSAPPLIPTKLSTTGSPQHLEEVRLDLQMNRRNHSESQKLDAIFTQSEAHQSYAEALELARSLRTSTHRTTVHKMQTILKLCARLSKQCSETEKSGEFVAHAMEVIFKLVHQYKSTSAWTDMQLEGFLNSICEELNVADLKTLWRVACVSEEEEEETAEIPANSIRIQLQHMGPSSRRDVESKPDARVNFLADPWQVEVLDGIDSGHSLLITAPTSSGKSFVAFYAMEKELKASKDSVVVFVAPTLALVNQVQAEVYQRFHNKFPQYPGISLFGSFTRDMRVVPTGCRVLVTVPACLEILLLSRPLHKTWVPKLKTIIFDEIHSISSDDSSTWARLLTLAPCPFIALSATIGHLDGFADYLRELTNGRLKVIQHYKRYNDIEKRLIEPVKSRGKSGDPPSPDAAPIASPTKTPPPPGQIPYEESFERFQFVYWHPWAHASLGHFLCGPPPASFSPRDSLFLFHAMEKLVRSLEENNSSEGLGKPLPEALREGYEALRPERFFLSAPPRLTQSHTRAYEASLKSWFCELSVSCPEHAQTLLEALKPSLQTRVTNWWPRQLKSHFKANIAVVVRQLQEADRLPAIVFNFERAFCEDIAAALYKAYRDGEEKDAPKAKKKTTLPAPARSSPSNLLSPSQTKPIASTSNPFGILEEEEEEEDETEEARAPALTTTSSMELTPSTKPARIVRLTLDGEILKKEVLDQELGDLRAALFQSKDGQEHAWMIDALRYGVGVHHSGLRKEYKDAVERYFRMRQVKVVIATSTLAVGINMPCRSTVFMGDSHFLTPQEYRQMSGRSGRRGIDLQGYSYFWGLPLARIAYLENALLNPIESYFPMSISTILRASMIDPTVQAIECTSHKKKSPDERRHDAALSDRVFNLFRRSLFIHQRPEQWVQVMVHLSSTLEYLVDEGLMSLHGVPLNLAGIVSHLSWTEPSNLVVARFLVSDVARELAQRAASSPNERALVHSQLLLFFSSLFEVLPLSKLQRNLMTCKETRKKMAECNCDHVLILPNVEPSLQTFVDQHRAKCLDIVNRSLLDFVRSHTAEESTQAASSSNSTLPTPSSQRTPVQRITLRPETALPLSRAQTEYEAFACPRPTQPPSLVSLLKSTSFQPELISPFVGMVNPVDRVNSVSEIRFLREGLSLSSLALLPNLEDLLGFRHGLNAYIYDMYHSENFEWLLKFNIVRPSDLRKNLKRFMLTLLTIAAASRRFFTQTSDSHLVTMLNDFAKEFRVKYEQFFDASFDQSLVGLWAADAP